MVPRGVRYAYGGNNKCVYVYEGEYTKCDMPMEASKMK
eukprot:CAMPEP_0172486512 /NCGR_PEP_ID=MMETSP1066-20121228/15118_1 /TAXON_ID=671091 /ORGANISM="Coscinodiscus wailesii, Strain CCMP2513" /LENGTH=37 /DNA_ID= /DNA_START= /DNA_END= /DNA_ORIENTATION=